MGITTFRATKFVNSNDFHSLMSVQAIQEGKERGYYNTHIGKIAKAGKNKQIILFER
ncbi:MAG: hypothetical protein IPM82_28505 [Saprospiraceae bacterium]|nr:hypothetical protein [Saprospiraceae bacterium]